MSYALVQPLLRKEKRDVYVHVHKVEKADGKVEKSGESPSKMGIVIMDNKMRMSQVASQICI